MIIMNVLQETAKDRVSPEVLDSLLHRLATGDKTALEQLYRETRAAVYGFSLSITKNGADAEDVLQETYIKAWNAAGGYSAKGNPMAWLLTIAKNLSLMKLREHSRYQDLEPDEWDALAVPDTSSAAADRHLLSAAMIILSDEERQIILLHAVSGLKHREIASLLDLALPTVLSKYHRSLKKLRNYIEGADAND
jgi:RNA polymerase sigma factor (sigma-70 family)